MSQIIPFSFEAHEVRVIRDGQGEPWVVAKDVAESLGYVWNGAARIAHVPEEWRGVTSVVTPSGSQQMATLSEHGLYFFVARSDKPKALAFQKWIAGEVLPSIRKTGSYSAPGRQGASSEVALLRQLAATAQRAAELLEENERLHRQLDTRQAPALPTHRARSEHPWLGRLRAWTEAHSEVHEVTTGQLLVEALGIPEPTNAQRGAVGTCMRALGWGRARRRLPALHWVFTQPAERSAP